MAVVIADILAITDPNWLIVSALQEVLYPLEITYYTERIAADSANDTADIVGVAAAIASLTVAVLYQNLADDYYNLYDKQRQFYYNNFQQSLNGEAGLTLQVFALPLYTPQYAAQVSALTNFADPEVTNEGAFSSVWWADHARMYEDTPFNSSIDAFRGGGALGFADLMDSEAAIDDFATYLYRYEEHRQIVYNERNWEWQNQALNYAIKQANVVESGLATSFKFLDESMGNMSDFFATQSNGLSKHSAYIHSLASTSANLSASTRMGRGLEMSTNLGQDRYKAFPRDVQQDTSKRIMRGYDVGAA